IGRRLTVASGIWRELTGARVAGPRPGCTNAQALAGPTSADRLGERPTVDVELEELVAVDQDHRDPDPVLELERVIAVDVDLLIGERRALALCEDHLPGLVAQTASRARVHPDGRGHGPDATSADHGPTLSEHTARSQGPVIQRRAPWRTPTSSISSSIGGGAPGAGRRSGGGSAPMGGGGVGPPFPVPAQTRLA